MSPADPDGIRQRPNGKAIGAERDGLVEENDWKCQISQTVATLH
jgi:hypothetical protein